VGISGHTREQGHIRFSSNQGGGVSVGEMRAVVQDRYGSADTLTIATIERPDIAPDEVPIEVAAAGVDRGVWHLLTGKPIWSV
jgi:hypothetical protein